MSKFYTSILFRIAKRLIDKNLMAVIMELVKIQFSNDIPGADKRENVERSLAEITGSLGEVLSETAGYLINLAIEVAVSYLVARYDNDEVNDD